MTYRCPGCAGVFALRDVPRSSNRNTDRYWSDGYRESATEPALLMRCRACASVFVLAPEAPPCGVPALRVALPVSTPSPVTASAPASLPAPGPADRDPADERATPIDVASRMPVPEPLSGQALFDEVMRLWRALQSHAGTAADTLPPIPGDASPSWRSLCPRVGSESTRQANVRYLRNTLRHLARRWLIDSNHAERRALRRTGRATDTRTPVQMRQRLRVLALLARLLESERDNLRLIELAEVLREGGWFGSAGQVLTRLDHPDLAEASVQHELSTLTLLRTAHVSCHPSLAVLSRLP